MSLKIGKPTAHLKLQPQVEIHQGKESKHRLVHAQVQC